MIFIESQLIVAQKKKQKEHSSVWHERGKWTSLKGDSAFFRDAELAESDTEINRRDEQYTQKVEE